MGVEPAVLPEQIDTESEALEKLLATESTFADYKAVADDYVSRANLDAAFQVYKACIARLPDEADGYRELGVVQERLEDFDGQVDSYRKALTISDEQPYWLYVTLARLLAERGRKIESIGLYRLGFDQHSDEVDGLSKAELARLLSEQGDVDAALVNYQQAIELQPELEWVSFCIEALHYNCGVKYMMLGAISKAERCFNEVERIKPSWETPIWFGQGESAWPRGKLDLVSEFEEEKPEGVSWPRISIVTPSLNQGNFIEESILSVLNQRYQNVEYIVVDGESTDETLSILAKYQDQISIVLVESDTGQSNAINKGFRLATGDLLGWLNSDDMLSPGALHQLALLYLRSKCGDVFAGLCTAHRGGVIEMVRKPMLGQTKFTLEVLSDMHRWQKGEFFFQPEMVFTRKIWEECGGSLDESLHYAMDQDLWLRFAEAGATLELINWPIASFRKHDNQKTVHEEVFLEELLKVMTFHGDKIPKQ